MEELILNWAEQRGILHKENAGKQRLKLIEEAGEVASAYLKGDIDKLKDGIGDCAVVLIILAGQLEEDIEYSAQSYDTSLPEEMYLENIIRHSFSSVAFAMHSLKCLTHKLELDFDECLNLAWNEIKDRKGKTVNGSFIKDGV